MKPWRRVARRLRSPSPAGRAEAPDEAPPPPSPEELKARAEAIGWFHSIDLTPTLRTAGVKSAERLRQELDDLNLPDDLSGKSVLDVGAWDGYFSFALERRGASRVVALDHYAWAVDQAEQRRRSAERVARGERLRPWHEDPELWRPDELPGKAGFDLAKLALGSRVEAVVGDFMTMDLEPLGRFDVVLFLGVLYHLENPFAALRRLASVTAGVCVIETVCAVFPGFEHHALWEFFETDELDGDPTNWWAPNAAALCAMCRAAGFAAAELKGHPAPTDPPNPGYDFHYGRAIVHAIAPG
jgi:tRNA (mo5U34)-methyltransferase